MRKRMLILISLAVVMFGAVTFVNAATISISWEDTVDSAINDEVVVSSPGIYDISILVSGIETGDTEIFELQFDLVVPTGWSFSGQPIYGNAVTGWIIKMGGIQSSNTYREFSAEFGASSYPLQNGLLVEGLQVTIPSFSSQLDEVLHLGNAQGDYANYLEFADLNVKSIPIPGAAWLLCSGLVGLVGIRRRFAN